LAISEKMAKEGENIAFVRSKISEGMGLKFSEHVGIKQSEKE